MAFFAPFTPFRSALSRRGLLTAAGATAAAGMVTACGGSGLPGDDGGGGGGGGGEGGSLQFWLNHSADEEKQFKAVIALFEEANPGTKVSMLNIADFDQYYTKINTAAVGGGLPDVFYARSIDVTPNGAREWSLPLTDLLAADEAEVDTDDFWPAHREQMSYKGELHSLPYDFSCFAMYVNTSMFKAEGVDLPTDDWTWDDFYEIASKFVTKDGKRQTRWGGTWRTDPWYVMGLLRSNGGDTFDAENTSCVIDSPENRATLGTLAEEISKGTLPADGATPAGVDPFVGELVAMKLDGSWALPSTRDAVGDAFEWDVVRLPKGSSGERAVSSSGGGWSISASSSQPDLAWKFLKFLANSDSQRSLIVEPTRSVPGRQSSATEWSETAEASGLPPANVGAFPQQLEEDAVNWSYPAFYSEFATSWSNRAATLGGKGDPAKILAEVQAETNTAAERY